MSVTANTLEERVIANFPFPNIREPQKQVLKETAEAIAEGKKFIVVEAPTGFGKSAYGVALAKTAGQSYLITATKDLQEQYLRDFPYIKLVKGRNNFDCHWEIEEQDKEGKQQLLTFVKGGKTFKPTADDGDCTVNRKTKCPYYMSKRRWLAGGTTQNGRLCDYYSQKYEGGQADHTIYNYKYFLPNALYGKDFKERPMIIFDECHELEGQIKDFLTLNLNLDKLDEILTEGYRTDSSQILESKDENAVLTTKNWDKMIAQLYSELTVFVDNGKEEIEAETGEEFKLESEEDEEQKQESEEEFDEEAEDEKGKLEVEQARGKSIAELLQQETVKAEVEQVGKREESKRIKKLVKQVNYSDRLRVLVDKFLADMDMNRAWIVSEFHRNDKGRITNIIFTPVVVGSVARKIFEKGNIIVMMSATVLDHESFCKSIGLDPSLTKFIQVGSDFPIENRQIHCLNIAHLNYETLQDEQVVKKIVDTVDKLLWKHGNEKGIIHTTSKRQVQWIMDGVSLNNRDRFLTTTLNAEDGIKREKVIEQHVNSPYPTVLLSPSFQTGLDLKDDLARFAIIIKVPWPDLKDRWIAARKKVDPQWYIWQTALKMIQAYGRAIRSKEDHATTYVLDSGFVDFCRRYRRILPKWFTDAILVHTA